MSNTDYRFYTAYMCELLKERANDAKLDVQNSKEGLENYNKGKLKAYHRLIALLKEQAPSFDIDEAILGLADIHPDVDLV